MISNGREYTILNMTTQSIFESRITSDYAMASVPHFLIPKLREVISIPEVDTGYSDDFLSDRADKFIFLLDRIRGEMLKNDPAIQRIKVLITNSPEPFSKLLEDRLIEDRIEPLRYTYVSNVVGRAVDEGYINNPISHKSKLSFIILRPYKRLFEAW